MKLAGSCVSDVVIVCVALFLCGLLTACVPSTGGADETEMHGDDVGVAEDAAHDDTTQAEMCEGGGLVCGARCVNIQHDMQHCGGCDQPCHPGTMSCRQGECACLRASDELCGGRCVDSSVNAKHCGACGVECAGGEICTEGRCISLTETTEIIDVVHFTNLARRQGQNCGSYGYQPPTHDLVLNEHLNEAAFAHSEDMAKYEFMSHDGSDGSDFVERIERTAYTGRAVGENVAMGYRDGEEVVQAWIDSEGHCQNLMNPGATTIGVGYATTPQGVPYWTQLFGR